MIMMLTFMMYGDQGRVEEATVHDAGKKVYRLETIQGDTDKNMRTQDSFERIIPQHHRYSNRIEAIHKTNQYASRLIMWFIFLGLMVMIIVLYLLTRSNGKFGF